MATGVTEATKAAGLVGGVSLSIVAILGAAGVTVAGFAYHLDQIISYMYQYNGPDGLTIATDNSKIGLYIADRATGEGVYYQPGILFWGVFGNLPDSLKMGERPLVSDNGK